MKRILYIHHTGEFVGSARSLFYLIKELDRTKYEPVLLITYEGPVRRHFEKIGVKVYHSPLSHIWEAPSPPWYDFYHNLSNWFAFAKNQNLLKMIQEIKPDIIHINDTALLSAAITAKFAKIPLVTHVRSVVNNCIGLKLRQRLLLKKIYELSDKLIAISEEYTSQFTRKDKIDIVNNSVDFEEISQEIAHSSDFRGELGIGNNECLVGMIGALNKHKGAWDFIESIGILVNRFKIDGIRAVIIGPINSKTKLSSLPFIKNLSWVNPLGYANKLLKKYSIEEKVKIIGSRANIYDIINALDIVVFPSRLEAVGRPIIEAAAIGKPSVVTMSTKKTEIIIDGITGLITDTGKPLLLAEAIKKLSIDKKLRTSIGEAGSKYAMEKFDSRKNVTKVQKIYENILKDGSKINAM